MLGLNYAENQEKGRPSSLSSTPKKKRLNMSGMPKTT